MDSRFTWRTWVEVFFPGAAGKVFLLVFLAVLVGWLAEVGESIYYEVTK